MKAFLFIIVSLLASVSTMAQNVQFDIEADLQRLDSVVANSANYDRQKQQNINLIKRSAGTYVTPTERYNFYKRMYRVHEVRQNIMHRCARRWQAGLICPTSNSCQYVYSHCTSIQ